MLLATVRNTGETHTPNYARAHQHQGKVGVAGDPGIKPFSSARDRPPGQPNYAGVADPIAFALIASNSDRVMMPLSSSLFAFSISLAGPPAPVVWRT